MKKSQMNNFAKTLFLFVIILYTYGCATMNLVSEAQDNFNAAAAYENSTKFNQESFELIQVNNYAVAYSKINEALKKDIQLKNDGLLGTALTLKALCEWKLGKDSLAMISRGKALNELSGQPRDKVIMKALPALIKTDQANAKLMASQITENNSTVIKLEDYESIRESIDGALKDYDKAIIGNSEHSIRSYIQMSKISAITILYRASTDTNDSDIEDTVIEEYIIPNLKDLKKLLGEDSKIVKHYQYILGQKTH